MSIERFLSAVKAISAKYDLIDQKTGRFYNIFDIANISTDEVNMCRVLCDLLSPTGSHCQGSAYLRLFLEEINMTEVDGIAFTNKEYDQARVLREYIIEGERRIDLYILIGKHKLPIEVKIFAGDQWRQCYDYHKYSTCDKVFYLTLNAYAPSCESQYKLTTDQVCLLSFNQHILNWLERCLSMPQTIRIAPIREVLQQLILTIQKLTGEIKGEKAMEIQSLITASSDNMRTAVEIERTLRQCRENMIIKIFSDLVNGLMWENRTNYPRDYSTNQYVFVRSYYNNKTSSYPMINFMIRDNVTPDFDLLFGVELGWQFWAGFHIYPHKGSDGIRPDDDVIAGLLPKLPLIKGRGNWLYGRFLPGNEKRALDNAPDFKSYNNAYYALFDEESYKEYIKNTLADIQKIRGMLS